MALLPQIPIPQTIRDFHSSISVSVDYLYVQGITMLHSISGSSYKFRKLQPIFKAKANKDNILKGIRNIINTYQSRGITVEQIEADNEFACVQVDILPTRLNTVAAEEHVGEIE